jgi:hypothetical protein
LTRTQKKYWRVARLKELAKALIVGVGHTFKALIKIETPPKQPIIPCFPTHILQIIIQSKNFCQILKKIFHALPFYILSMTLPSKTIAV